MKRIAVCLKPLPTDSRAGYTIWKRFPFGPTGINVLNYSRNIKRLYHTELIAFVMAPMKFYESIKNLLSFGFDRLIYISDSNIAGADSLGTSKVLASAIIKYNCDAVIIGKYSEDSSTGQVPVQLSMGLNYECVLDSKITKESLLTGGIVVCVDNQYEEIYPSLNTITNVAESNINVLNLSDLGLQKKDLRFTDVIHTKRLYEQSAALLPTKMLPEAAAKLIAEIVVNEARKRK